MTTYAPITLDSTGHRIHTQAAELRAAAPAVPVGVPDGLTVWSVTRGDVIKKLLTHPDVAKDARTAWPGYEPGYYPWLTSWVDVRSMLTADGGDHARLKKLIGRAFSPRRIEAMRPAIEQIVADLLTAIGRYEPGEIFDLRNAYAYPVPTQLIAGLFGVPDEQRPAMLSVIDAVLDTTADREQAADTRDRLYAAMGKLIATKRWHPGEDMTSLLLAAQEEDGDRLSEEELVSTLILMIGAGSETAVSLIGHATYELLSNEGQLRRVLAHPERWDDVIEETLRLHPPIMHIPMRFTTADIDLGEGVTIPGGSPLLMGFGAHGRDPAVHERPETFDLDRADKSHLAFGYGMHYCLGAALAKLEARIALPALFETFPDIHLAGQHQPQPSFIAHGYETLPVRVTAPADR
ncbi:cytochrome P450 [Streptomyces sp. N2-109]|uniref:Cytochrome P450 n=1 Tax=Streptomyces gossypii TaxID=2883101 RepID=A0ABT2JMP9_9ACTN|nr:cytochrome P450 [Streptomyces gossypii]MCT2588993.1 cytochrome P450 [Streptomyces gossypii]